MQLAFEYFNFLSLANHIDLVKTILYALGLECNPILTSPKGKVEMVTCQPHAPFLTPWPD